MNIIDSINWVKQKPYGIFRARRKIWEKGNFISVQMIIHNTRTDGKGGFIMDGSNRVRYYYPTGDHEDYKPTIDDIESYDWETDKSGYNLPETPNDHS